MKVYEYNNEQYTDKDAFRKVFRNVSFPKVITDDMLMSRGVIIRDIVAPEDTVEERKAKMMTALNERYMQALTGNVSVKLNDNITIRMLFAERDLLMVRAMLDKMTDVSIDNGVLVDVDDNVYMNLDKDTVNRVYQTMLDANFNLYMKLKQYQIAINSAETDEDLDKINISF